MEYAMTNEQIAQKLSEYQNQLYKCDLTTFELHEQVINIKEKMAELRRMCTHKNAALQFVLEDGRCKYCKCKVK